jgi:class 3 adenylate cyclase
VNIGTRQMWLGVGLRLLFRTSMRLDSTRIAAILAADAVSCRRAMSTDEDRALAALTASRRVIDALILARRGRIFSTDGDSVLAEFGCAGDIHMALAPARRFEFGLLTGIGCARAIADRRARMAGA